MHQRWDRNEITKVRDGTLIASSLCLFVVVTENIISTKVFHKSIIPWQFIFKRLFTCLVIKISTTSLSGFHISIAAESSYRAYMLLDSSMRIDDLHKRNLATHRKLKKITRYGEKSVGVQAAASELSSWSFNWLAWQNRFIKAISRKQFHPAFPLRQCHCQGIHVVVPKAWTLAGCWKCQRGLTGMVRGNQWDGQHSLLHGCAGVEYVGIGNPCGWSSQFLCLGCSLWSERSAHVDCIVAPSLFSPHHTSCIVKYLCAESISRSRMRKMSHEFVHSRTCMGKF